MHAEFAQSRYRRGPSRTADALAALGLSSGSERHPTRTVPAPIVGVRDEPGFLVPRR
jgi:hypothetical protein